MSSEKIKKAVIREDLLSITKDFKEAVILNQFIYWSERVSDADILIAKENEIAQKNGEEEREPLYGWIYKTAEELADEVMLGLSASQIRRYINNLVEYKYISKRNNPKYKWDRTLQYKVNLVNIARALKKNGYPLSDYKIDIPDNENSIAHGCAFNETHKENQTCANERAIPETTTENTNKDYHLENTTPSPTELNTFSKEKGYSPAGLNTSLSEERAEKRSKRENNKFKWIVVKNHIISVMEKFGYDSTSEETEAAIEVFRYYYMEYKRKTGHNHPNLNDKTMRSVLERFLEGTEEVDGCDADDHMAMIEEHFCDDTHYGMEIDWNIQHFMTEDIRNYLYQRIK